MEDRRAPGPHEHMADQSPKSLRNQLESMASELDSEIARQTIANQPKRKVASATAISTSSKPVTVREQPRTTSSSSSVALFSAPGPPRSKSQGPLDPLTHPPSESNAAKAQTASDGVTFTRNSPTIAVESSNFDGRPTVERQQINFPDVAKLPLSKTKLSPLDTSKHPKMPLMPLGSTGALKSAAISEPISMLNNGGSSSSSSIPYAESASTIFHTTAEITQTASKQALYSSPSASAQHSRRNSLQNQLPSVRTSASAISSKLAINSEDIEDLETAKASKSDGELYHSKRCFEQDEEEEEGLDKVLSLTEVIPQAIRHTHKHWHTYIPPPNTEELKIITDLQLKLAEALKSDPNLTLIASQDSLRTTGTNDTNQSTSVESDGSRLKKSFSVKSKAPLSSVIKTAKERMERLKQEEAAARELAAAETARLKLEKKKAEQATSAATLGEAVKADDPQTNTPPLAPVKRLFGLFSSCCGSRNSRKTHPQQPKLFPMELSDFCRSNSGGSRSSVYLGSICTAQSQPSSASSGSLACVSLPRPTTLHAIGSTSKARNSNGKTSASRRKNTLDYVIPLGGERAFSSTTSASTTTSKTISLGPPSSHLSSLHSSTESNQASFLTAFAKAVQNTQTPNTLRHPSRHSSCAVPLPPIAQQKIRGPRRPQCSFEAKPALTPCQEPLKTVKVSQGRYSVLRVQDTIGDESKASGDSVVTMHEETPSPPKFGAYLASRRECASSLGEDDWNHKTSNGSADGDILELDTLSSFGECSWSPFSSGQQSKSPVPRIIDQDMGYEVKVVPGTEPEFHAVVEEVANESCSDGTLSSFSSARMEFNGQLDLPTRQGSHGPGVVERAPTTTLGGTEEISCETERNAAANDWGWHPTKKAMTKSGFVATAGALSTHILSTAALKGLFPHPLISTCRPAAKVFVLNSRDSANAFISTVTDTSSNLKTHISSVGFDVEFWSNMPALVQIAFTPDIVGVFQLQPICGGMLSSQNSLDLDSSRFPATLKRLLESQAIAKVGVGIRQDAELLAKYLNVQTENKIDCAMLPIARKIGARSLVSLYHTFVDDSAAFKKVNPVATGFNWGSSDLPIPAIEYAANDALASLLVYQAIQNVSLKDMSDTSDTSDAQNAVRRLGSKKAGRQL
ncbi:hypothetical protein HDU81_010108 [Chytriomyces hyalinus]|nr:hypothetical protein HDU81_010108 [Chytriomyces hyalinus]